MNVDIAPRFLTSALEDVNGQRHVVATLCPGKELLVFVG
jgi:hypothetical protein